MGQIPLKSLVKGKKSSSSQHSICALENIPNHDIQTHYEQSEKYRWLCLHDQMNLESAQILHLMVHMDATCATFATIANTTSITITSFNLVCY
jgi:hypothetical protein